MSKDGQEPPTLEAGSLAKRPKLSVIIGGANEPHERPDPPALARSSVSAVGRARLLRALRMLGGERAFLFVWDEQEFTLSEACATDENGNEPRDRNVMWSLLDRITSQRAPLVMAGTDDQPTDAMMSGVTAPLRMAVAVPLLAGDNLKGVACFDKRIHRGQFVVSDALAAVGLLSSLGIDAARLAEVLKGSAEPVAEASAQDIVAALLSTLSPAPHWPSTVEAHVHMAHPDGREVHFWQRQDKGDGSQRIISCRLENGDADPDLLVTRSLACVRALGLLSDASADDQLHGMTFELERAGKEAFSLHAAVLEINPRDRTLGLWQAGEAGVFAWTPNRAARALIAPSAPLARGKRTVTKTALTLDAGEQIVCIQRPRLFSAEGQSAALDWLSSCNSAADTASRAQALNKLAGSGASIMWLALASRA